MANTRLTTPGELGASLKNLSRSLESLSHKMVAEDRYWKSEIARGEHALTLKTRMDNMFEGVNAELRRLGQELGNESTVPLLSTLFKTQWRAGVNNSLRYFKTGASNTLTKTSSGAAQGLVLIDYLDVSPNYDIFSGLALNDVIRISNCSDVTHDGLKSVRWDVKPKGTVGTASTISTYGPNDSGDTFWDGNFRNALGTGWSVSAAEWAITGNAAVFTSAGSTARTLTHALSGMTTTGLYVVQFDLTVTDDSPSCALKVSIGGDYYWELSPIVIAGTTTYSFVTNSPSTTPTLTFTATPTGATPVLTVDNVYVYGYQGLMVSEAFPSEETGLDTIITLEQTAA